MNSLTELNAVGASVLEVDDTRPATVLFDKDTRYADLDTEVTYTSNIINFEPSINIEEIRNYASANARFRVEIITSGATPGTIDFGTLPTGITQSLEASTYTLSGFKDYTQWDSVKNFTWTMPANYANEDLFFLKISIIYYDEDTNSEQTLSWFYYDDLFYYLLNAISVTTLTLSSYIRIKQLASSVTTRFVFEPEIRRLVGFAASITSGFSQIAQGEPTSIVTVSSAFSQSVTGQRNVPLSTNQISSFTQLTDTTLTFNLLQDVSSPITSNQDHSHTFSRDGNYLITLVNNNTLRYYELSADRATVTSTSDISIGATATNYRWIDTDSTGEYTTLVTGNNVYTVTKSTNTITTNAISVGYSGVLGGITSNGVYRWYSEWNSSFATGQYIIRNSSNTLIKSIATTHSEATAALAYDTTNSRYWFVASTSVLSLYSSADTFNTPSTLISSRPSNRVCMDSSATYIAAGFYRFLGGNDFYVRILKRTGTTWSTFTDILVYEGYTTSATIQYMRFSQDGKRLIMLWVDSGGYPNLSIYDRINSTYELQVNVYNVYSGTNGNRYPPIDLSDDKRYFVRGDDVNDVLKVYKLI